MQRAEESPKLFDYRLSVLFDGIIRIFGQMLMLIEGFLDKTAIDEVELLKAWFRMGCPLVPEEDGQVSQRRNHERKRKKHHIHPDPHQRKDNIRREIK